MPTQADVRALVETRVRVALKAPGEVSVEGILRALTPADVLVVSDPRGHLTTVPFALVAEVDDARYTCAECGTKSNTTYDGQRCSNCYRDWCQKQPPPSELCEDCGGGGAFYSPAAKKFRCPQCHAKAGSLSGIGAEARVLEMAVSECKGGDTDDDRHRWFHIRGHRWHCKFCPARRFTDPPLGTIWRESNK